MVRTASASLIAVLLAAGPVLAQPGPRILKMTLHPAAAPVPALKYALFPELHEMHTGNAALTYFRAYSPEWYPNLTKHPNFSKFHEWLDLPLAKAPLDEAHGVVAAYILRDVDRAARTESCDWQMLPRLREENYMMLIPDMQGFRTLAMLLALRARLEMREGKFDKAAYTFQTGFGMSRHVGEAPTLITYLIGAATAHTMLERVEEFVQQPGAPNLYWSLTDLPRPLIDLRRPLQGERVMIDSLFPEVRKALADPTEPPIPIQTLRAGLAKLAGLGESADPIARAVQAATAYPRARTYFLDRGRAAEDLDAVSVTQLAMMYALAHYDIWADETYKLNSLPYWEVGPRIKELEDRRLKIRGERQRVGFAEALAFNPIRIYLGKARLQRRIDLLRCVEAVRLYAAANGGALPDSLKDIRDVPIPDDPITGKAFVYTKEANRAILEGLPPAGEAANDYNSVRIEIAMAKK